MRCGIGRMRPYPDPRGQKGGRGGPPFLPPSPMRGMMRDPFSLPPPRHGLPPPPSLPGPMGFRGRPPHPRARGMLRMPRGRFPPPRGVTKSPFEANWRWYTDLSESIRQALSEMDHHRLKEHLVKIIRPTIKYYFFLVLEKSRLLRPCTVSNSLCS
ncbi:protein diaphanous-like isoform X2 [Chelonia mydas]|uniref:protein diaphanous-like isoform X2 n=1 Tax=Chelonia mydas TaxID=8469 RepID=UPI001CA889F1|nr:protein diaphanous-like isoform X2 [Chelonia mydas]